MATVWHLVARSGLEFGLGSSRHSGAEKAKQRDVRGTRHYSEGTTSMASWDAFPLPDKCGLSSAR